MTEKSSEVEKPTTTQPEKHADPIPMVTLSKTDFDNLIVRLEKAENNIKGLNLRTAKKEKAETPTPPKTETPTPKTETPTPTTEPQTKHEHEQEPAQHYNAWQKFCPTCGDQNPAFKDETQCTRCGMHLGAKENLSTAENPNAPIKVCPNCGAGKDGETVHVRLLK